MSVTEEAAPRESVTVNLRDTGPVVVGAVQLVLGFEGAEKLPEAAAQAYARVSPGLGSCALATSVTLAPGATTSGEAVTESMIGASLENGVEEETSWRVRVTSVRAPAVTVTFSARPS